MSKAYIYRIRNKIDDKIYIGSTKVPKKREYQHFYSLKNNNHCNKHLQSAWNKYGESNFVFEILEEVDLKDQYIVEQQYLHKLSPFNEKGYNLCRNARYGHGEFKNGEDNFLSKHTNKQVIYLKKLLAEEDYSLKKLSDLTGIDVNNITNIKRFASWKDVGSQYNDKILEKKAKKLAINNYQNILLQESAYIMYKEYKMSFETISKLLHVPSYKISKYCFEQDLLDNYDIINCSMCGKEMIRKTKNHKYCTACRDIGKRCKSKKDFKNKRDKLFS